MIKAFKKILNSMMKDRQKNPFGNLRDTPFGKPGYAEKLYWRKMVRNGNLPVVDSVCVWSDVCGFGSALADAGLDLKRFIKEGPYEVLPFLYDKLGHIGKLHYKNGSNSPQDMDRCVVLNDGIAKVTDIRDTNLEPVSIGFWMRDLVISHWQTLNLIHERYCNNLGLKTVISSGQRMQYMKEFTTGEDMLQHGDNISNWGQQLLNTCFTFSPAQLQMNTAFARAFHIDEIGTKGGIPPNGFYIDSVFRDMLSKRLLKDELKVTDSSIVILKDGIPALSFDIISSKSVENKLFRTNVHRIGKVTVGLGLEGSETSFDVSDMGVDPFDSKFAQQ